MTTLSPGARIWRGAKGFDTGGTPNVPKYGSTTQDAPSIPGGPVSPAEWNSYSPGFKKLAIKTWATNACRAEGVDETHWVPYLEKIVSFESGAPGVSGTGNPNVVNMYDANAKANIPSIGLAQVIQDNAPGQNLLDPVTNLRASIRYIKSTYGDVTNIPEAQGIQVGYQTGGRIWRGARGFDEGGPSDPRLEDFGDIETGKGRWGFPYKGARDTNVGDQIHEWEIAPIDAPAREDALYGPEGRQRSQTFYLDPKRAHVQPGGEDEFGPTRPKLVHNNPNAITDYRDLPTQKGFLYRGMSDEEYQNAKARGYFESDKTYNIVGPSTDANQFQADKTFFSTNIHQSANYATDFAPWQYKPTFSRPSHVIAISDRPDLARGPLGTDPLSTEVGVPGRIPFDSVVEHWTANVAGMMPGEYSYRPSDYAGEDVPIRGGSPSADVEWEQVPTQDDIIKEAMEGINERGGITIDLTGHQPAKGYGYAPSKETELMFEAGKITPEDVDAYIDSHFEDLQSEGMHFGAWVSEEDSAVYLDVSKVGAADAETLRAAMKAEQLGIWDFGAPTELGELRIGRIDDAGKYIPLGQASDLHAEHAREVQRAIESRSATSPSEVPREPEPEVEPKPEPGPKIWREGKSYKVGADGPGKGGPGAARAPEKASVPELLGKAGKVLGPALNAAGIAVTVVEGTEQVIDPKKREQLLHPSATINESTAAQQDLYNRITYGNNLNDVTKKQAAFNAYLKAHGGNFPDWAVVHPGQSGNAYGHWLQGKGPMPKELAPFVPGMQTGGQVGKLKLHSGFCVRHVDGTTTRHTLTQTGPKHYEADGDIKLRPGDTIEIDGHRS